MFEGFMVDAWIVGSIVALVAGVVGFFAVLRGSAFAAHALPNGAFAGAAAASLIGVNVLLGLVVFAVGGALGIGVLGRRGRHDVATALALVAMLGLGALFISLSAAYAPQVYSLLFGEILGIAANEVLPTAALGLACVLVCIIIYRPLMLSSVLPEVGSSRGISTFAIELVFLVVLAIATAMTVPVVGSLLIFTLMIGAPAAARSLTDRPLAAVVLSSGLALLIVWVSIAASFQTDYPVGFFVGTLSAGSYVLGRLFSGFRGRRRRYLHRLALDPSPGAPSSGGIC